MVQGGGAGKGEADFFLAHAGGDVRAAEERYDLLSSHARVFLDSRCLHPGDPWDVALPEAQRRSTVTVVLVSSRTDTAWYARDEVAAALDLAHRPGSRHQVVPVYLDWPLEIPFGLHRLHALLVSPQLPLKEVAHQLLALVLDRPSPQHAANGEPVGLQPQTERVVPRTDRYQERLRQLAVAHRHVVDSHAARALIGGRPR